ncbi:MULTISPECIES: hypothetical protein [Allobacillus]|uniref:DUF1433 domain-containing protein n=1 Tax=Allobacillus salarius TaxID=1955272 RepID=A0A556PQ35_9BACI|nr:hypothetical protein [Allobacillus salarius]TSJ66503.1 hypothetical protein FPQ13_04395 [Allobacillus salarius]
MKKLKVGIIPILVIIILLGGCQVNQNGEFSDENTNEIHDSVREYLLQEYEDGSQIELKKPYRGEMGSIFVDGTINDEQKFSATLNEDYSVSSIAFMSD